MDIKHLEVKRAYYNDPENVVVQMKCHNGNWADMVCEPGWNENTEYRIKPKTIRIGDIDVPEPVREALKSGEHYYVVTIAGTRLSATHMVYVGYEYEKGWLSRGLIHLTREDAELHANALILVSGGSVE